MIPIFQLTSSEYCAAIRSQLGKGAEHALYIYQEWFRTGQIQGHHPAFNNAPLLLEAIKAATDWSELEPSASKSDGATAKLLFKVGDGWEIESVVIPMEAGGTVCISSQVGCRMGCRFCETGRMGLRKKLTVAEIVGQVFHARHRAQGSIRNVVFMGMGEPFDHYEAVMQAFRVISDPHGLNIGPRHVTISTSGLVEGIRRLAQEEGPTPNLAVSINAPNDRVRNSLMPVNRTHSMADLHAAIRFYNDKTGREVLAAYVLMREVTDSLDSADQLAEYLRGLQVKINLIPYNPQSIDRFQAPHAQQVTLFKQRLIQHGYQVLLRTTKGDQIMAACGQLGKKRNPIVK